MIYPSWRSRWLTRLMRLFFRLLYHEFAWSYDLVAEVVSLGKWKDWVAVALPYLKGPRILEVGHGPGHLQLALQEQGMAPVGLDESRQMGLRAARRLRNHARQPLLIRADARWLPMAEASFDQVVATFPSEFIFESSTLSEICRVLLPGGELIVLPAAWITGVSPLEKMAAALFRITGQTPDWEDFEETLGAPFRQAGLNPQFLMEKRDSSEVLVIRAAKNE